MAKNYVLFCFILCLFYYLPASGQHQYHVSGVVKDSASLESLAGASILVKGNPAGIVTDKSGKFEFSFSLDQERAVMVVKFIGYESMEIPVSAGKSKLDISLKSDVVLQREVTVTDSRVPQSVLESPVTITKLDSKKIMELPQENFYAGLSSQKGIDVGTASLFYQMISMRGPANPISETVLQLTDGMDNTPPGQGFSIGNLAGETDLDIESIDIIPGSASAIYGDNAFSGLINITTKNPFVYKGLSAQVKTGVNYIDGKYHDPAIFNDVQVRYANVWKEKFAVKLNIGYARGTDWLLIDSTDIDPLAPVASRGPSNPGRNIWNIYGDENWEWLTLGPDSDYVNVSRTGYHVNDIFGAETNSLKLRTSLHYKLNKKTELSYLFSYSLFNTNVVPATWSFREFSVTYHKVELKNKNYFVRAYTIEDKDGHSFEAINVAWLINARWKPDSTWFSDYQDAYNGAVTGIQPYNHTLARNYADIGRVLPGTPTFDQWVDEFSSVSLNEADGARYEDRTTVQHVHGQYDFSSIFKWMKVIAGAEYRSRNLWSNGTMFIDYPPATYIKTTSYSGYVQCEKSLLKEKLALLASVRFDKYDIFDVNITPRVAAVYKLKNKHFFRASFQTGTRVPDPFDQYRDSNNGFLYWVGGLEKSDKKYNLHARSFEDNSIFAFSDTVNAYIEMLGEDSTDALIQRYKGMLKPSGLEYVHPERQKTLEVGYQCLLFDNKVHFDIALFGSIYSDLIAYQWVGLPFHGNPFDPDSLNAAAADFVDYWSNSNGMNVAVNAKEDLRWGGIEAGFEFNFWKNYIISGNFIYQKSSERDPDIDSWLFQVTPIKTNLSLSNPKCWKNFGFAVNWHWTDAFGDYWTGFAGESNNSLPANSVFDAQVTLQLPKLNSSIRFGASNVLNHYYQNVAYGAHVGGLYYVTILYSGK